MRMEQDRIAREAVNWVPALGKRKSGRPRTDWQQTVKQDISRGGVSWEQVPLLAVDRVAWKEMTALFKELAPILTSRGASLKIKGKVYKACVQTVMVYGSETWPMKTEDMKRLVRAERMMVRWMCGVSLRDRRSSVELIERLGIEGVAEVVRRGRLRWFGHLERKNEEDWVSCCREFEVAGAKSKGRSRKTWSECVKTDLRSLGMKREWAQDRVEWRRLIGGNRPTRASAETRTLNWK